MNYRKSRYDNVEREAEIRRKYQLNIIKQKCCLNCTKRNEQNCLKLEHTLENSVEVYKCANYLKEIS